MIRLQTIALAIADATALGIGAFILNAPRAFYASYGIAIGPDPNLLSELRAPTMKPSAMVAATLTLVPN